jgi:hypothetical protein
MEIAKAYRMTQKFSVKGKQRRVFFKTQTAVPASEKYELSERRSHPVLAVIGFLGAPQSGFHSFYPSPSKLLLKVKVSFYPHLYCMPYFW